MGGNQNKAHYLALCSWENLCRPKSMGGLGFRRFADMNNALVSKLGSLVLTQLSRLWETIRLNKYGHGANWLEGFTSSCGSPMWKGIVSVLIF